MAQTSGLDLKCRVGTSPSESKVNGTAVTLYVLKLMGALLIFSKTSQKTKRFKCIHCLSSAVMRIGHGFGYRRTIRQIHTQDLHVASCKSCHAMGLAARNFTATAWEEFKRNSFDWQASVYPDHWLGQWTMADTVDGAGSWGHDGLPGNWTLLPGLCTHPHAWPLVSFLSLLGYDSYTGLILFRHYQGFWVHKF